MIRIVSTILLLIDFVVGRYFKLHVCGYQNRVRTVGQNVYFESEIQLEKIVEHF